MSKVRTRVLIVSDTHGQPFQDKPLQSADVAIHCGDLTNGSKLDEMRAAISLIGDLNAPLKLVIAGNHDFTLDIPAFETKIAEATPPLDPGQVTKEYGYFGEAQRLLEKARDKGITFLSEGNYEFELNNGALLRVYASPWTPALGAWGFQYPPSRGHTFSINQGTDIAITHGPPRGILDRTHGRERAGCPDLFKSVARTRPAIHCFGHIHEGWGAKLVAWRPELPEGQEPSHFNAIDNDKSVLVESLAGITQSRFDTPDDAKKKISKVKRYNQDRCCDISRFSGVACPQRDEGHTLFVNAAVEGDDGSLSQKPFLVEIDLRKT